MPVNYKIYKVGGSIRDKLLGISSNDNDYVVVGATVDDMLSLGYKPVGRDFPVFLHPVTHEEYALARTEKKIGVGYRGFHFYTDSKITIEQDLNRRDLTINAIAEDAHGLLIDPYGGVADISNKVIRHVSDAFIEDPLRVIRAARFASRFNFTIVSETMDMMEQIVNSGELESLSRERIQMELEKAVTQSNLIIFFKILYDCGALDHILEVFKPLVKQPALSNELQLYFNQDNKIDGTDKVILLYYVIVQNLNLKDALSLVQNSLLTNIPRKLLSILITIYPQLLKFDIFIKKRDAKHILQLFNTLDILRHPDRFVVLQNLMRIIAQVKGTIDIINNAIIFLNKINNLFKKIDYTTLLGNNNLENKKEIVYNNKLDIINNYIITIL